MKSSWNSPPTFPATAPKTVGACSSGDRGSGVLPLQADGFLILSDAALPRQ